MRQRPKVDRVAGQLDLGDLRAHQRAAVATDRLRARHPAAPGRQVGHHRADVVVGDEHRHVENGLQQQHLRLVRRVLQREPAGDLERHVGGVDGVRLAVRQRRAYVDDGVARRGAVLHLCPDALLHRRDELLRDRAAVDLDRELEPGAGRQRLERHIAHRELPMPA